MSRVQEADLDARIQSGLVRTGIAAFVLAASYLVPWNITTAEYTETDAWVTLSEYSLEDLTYVEAEPVVMGEGVCGFDDIVSYEFQYIGPNGLYRKATVCKPPFGEPHIVFGKNDLRNVT